ncbi:MAG: periplasmic heavy metal sensor [Desulfovibrio sp.]|nr:MAG: periplasmic heavy metal sensor [Desulfovibrio sp.]
MNRYWKITLAAGLLVLFASAMALAQEDAPPQDQTVGIRGMFGMMDEETRDTVREVVRQHMIDDYPQQQLLQARQAELNALLFTESLDEAAIEAKITEIVELQAEALKAQVELRRALFEVTGMPVPDMGPGQGMMRQGGGPGGHGGRGGQGGPGGPGGHGGHGGPGGPGGPMHSEQSPDTYDEQIANIEPAF